MKNVKKLLEQMGDLTILDKNQMNLLIAGDGEGGGDPPPDGSGSTGGGGTGSGGETDPPITSGG